MYVVLSAVSLVNLNLTAHLTFPFSIEIESEKFSSEIFPECLVLDCNMLECCVLYVVQAYNIKNKRDFELQQ